MSTYAIGDLQGCAIEFEQLLELISFDKTKDALWLVGDLVNRGPQSLATLRAVLALGDTVKTVLGNHDLHLLAAYAGVRNPSRGDTLTEILEASDVATLIDWVRTRPLAYQADIGGRSHLMVHAGIVPKWDAASAIDRAQEVEAALRGTNWREFLKSMYGNEPSVWRDDLRGAERLRCIVNILTRLRFCTAEGVMDFSSNGGISSAPEPYRPWFEFLDAKTTVRLVTGHWSALGLHVAKTHLAIDTGCVWGGALTAIRLEDDKITQLPCPNFHTIESRA